MGAMASANQEAAALLREYADLLGLTGGDPFRARNYERAAKSVAGYPGDLATLPDKALTTIDGVGPSIAGEDRRVPQDGHVRGARGAAGQDPARRRGSWPRCRASGPSARCSSSASSRITSAAELAEAIRRGRLRGVSGFGPKTEERILRGIEAAAGDAALRDALRALPDGASVDDIYAVLAAQLPAGGRRRRGGAARSSGSRTSAATCTRTPTSPTASSPWRE